MTSWSLDDPESHQKFLLYCEKDRKSLLSQVETLYPEITPKTAAEKVEDIILDICGYHVVDRPLNMGQLAVCDFGSKTVSVNSQMKKFVGRGTDLAVVRRTTLAHELGHIRLHSEETEARFLGREFRHTGYILDVRSFHREREADLYASIFLTPEAELIRHPALKILHERRFYGEPMSTGELWKAIHQLAHDFRVTATHIKYRLAELGWLVVLKEYEASGLQKLKLV